MSARWKCPAVEVDSEIVDLEQHFRRQPQKFAPDPLIYEENGRLRFLPMAKRASRARRIQAGLLYREGMKLAALNQSWYVQATRGYSELEIEYAKDVAGLDRLFAKYERLAKKYAQECAKVDAKEDWNPERLWFFEEKLKELGPAVETARQLLAAAGPRIERLAGELRKIKRADRRPKRLKMKAQRLIACGLYGRRWDGDNCSCIYYREYGCKGRYCERCGPKNHNRMLAKYSRLDSWIEEYLASNLKHGLKVMDLTTRKTEEQKANKAIMPSRAQVEKFEEDIKTLLGRINKHVADRYGWKCSKMLSGLLYCMEFGGTGNNLHCHGLLLAPYIEEKWLKRQWEEISGAWDLNIAEAKPSKNESAFHAALAHALKYAGKYAGSSPNVKSTPRRLVALEMAFDGSRRVHTLGLLYRRLPKEERGENKVPCPCGKEGSSLRPRIDLAWTSTDEFWRLGIRNYDTVETRLGGTEATRVILRE